VTNDGFRLTRQHVEALAAAMSGDPDLSEVVVQIDNAGKAHFYRRELIERLKVIRTTPQSQPRKENA